MSRIIFCFSLVVNECNFIALVEVLDVRLGIYAILFC